jgi:hypothetical protein
MPRSSTSARTRAWAAVSSQSSVAADVRPATTISARRSAADRRHGAEPCPSRPDLDGRQTTRTTHEQQVEWPVDVEREPPSVPQVVDLVPGHLLQPARSALSAGSSGSARSDSTQAIETTSAE